MKFNAASSTRPCDSQRGSVVLVLLAFLVLMSMLTAATWHALRLSRQEVALIEKHQIERLAKTTNMPPVSAKPMSTQ